MSISGHKLYGPKGIGALYVRRRPRVRLEAQMSGGGQERGLRSGTVPTPLVVGLGAACAIAQRVSVTMTNVTCLFDVLYAISGAWQACAIAQRVSAVLMIRHPSSPAFSFGCRILRELAAARCAMYSSTQKVSV